MQTLIIKNGILKAISGEEEKKELEKKNWDYRMVTASGQFTVIDYDKDEARPYVKALLAKVNKLLEVKLLYVVIVLMVFSLMSTIVIPVFVLMRIDNVMEEVNGIKNAQTQLVKKEEVKTRVPQKVESVSDVKSAVSNMDTGNALSGALNPMRRTFDNR